MGNNLAELVDTGEKRDERGRKIVPVEQQREHLAAYAQSGLTQRAFAKRAGINYYTLVGWLKSARTNRPAAAKPRFQEMTLGEVVGQSSRLEVILPGGVVVRGANAAEVAELVRAIRC